MRVCFRVVVCLCGCPTPSLKFRGKHGVCTHCSDSTVCVCMCVCIWCCFVSLHETFIPLTSGACAVIDTNDSMAHAYVCICMHMGLHPYVETPECISGVYYSRAWMKPN